MSSDDWWLDDPCCDYEAMDKAKREKARKEQLLVEKAASVARQMGGDFLGPQLKTTRGLPDPLPLRVAYDEDQYPPIQSTRLSSSSAQDTSFHPRSLDTRRELTSAADYYDREIRHADPFVSGASPTNVEQRPQLTAQFPSQHPPQSVPSPLIERQPPSIWRDPLAVFGPLRVDESIHNPPPFYGDPTIDDDDLEAQEAELSRLCRAYGFENFFEKKYQSLIYLAEETLTPQEANDGWASVCNVGIKKVELSVEQREKVPLPSWLCDGPPPNYSVALTTRCPIVEGVTPLEMPPPSTDLQSANRGVPHSIRLSLLPDLPRYDHVIGIGNSNFPDVATAILEHEKTKKLQELYRQQLAAFQQKESAQRVVDSAMSFESMMVDLTRPTQHASISQLFAPQQQYGQNTEGSSRDLQSALNVPMKPVVTSVDPSSLLFNNQVSSNAELIAGLEAKNPSERPFTTLAPLPPPQSPPEVQQGVTASAEQQAPPQKSAAELQQREHIEELKRSVVPGIVVVPDPAREKKAEEHIAVVVLGKPVAEPAHSSNVGSTSLIQTQAADRPTPQVTLVPPENVLDVSPRPDHVGVGATDDKGGEKVPHIPRDEQAVVDVARAAGSQGCTESAMAAFREGKDKIRRKIALLALQNKPIPTEMIQALEHGDAVEVLAFTTARSTSTSGTDIEMLSDRTRSSIRAASVTAHSALQY